MDELKTNADGSVDIPLRKPLSIDGAQVKSLRMREPLVEDQLASDAAGGTDAQKEVAMIAALCMVTPADLKKLSLHDYKKVSAAFVRFVE